MVKLENLYNEGKDDLFIKKLNKIQNPDHHLRELLLNIIDLERDNGFVLNAVVKKYFRLFRKDNNDCSIIHQLKVYNDYTINESLLEVLGYDKMIPSFLEQKNIISYFYNFGDHIDYRYHTDPRYGLAAASAGWDEDIVREFLDYCLSKADEPLKYVAKNALKGKYVKLR